MEIGIVDQHDGDLAAQVLLLVIIPAALGRIDAVADEHQRRLVQRDLVLWLQALQGDVLAVDQLAHPVAKVQPGRRRLPRAHPYQRHLLHPAAILTARLQAGGTELLDQVIHRALFAGRGRRAALERRRGQYLHMPVQCLWVDPPARQVIGCMGKPTCKQAGGQQHDMHRVHDRHRHAGWKADDDSASRGRRSLPVRGRRVLSPTRQGIGMDLRGLLLAALVARGEVRHQGARPRARYALAFIRAAQRA